VSAVLNRREFAQTAIGLGLYVSLLKGAANRNIRIGHTGITWPNNQIDQAIRDIASLGFHGLETFGNVLEALETRGGVGALLEQNKLPLISAYCTANLTDAAALYSLSRNIGSAIGVSATSALLTSNIQTLHAQYAEQVTPFNRALQTGAAGLFLGPQTPFGAAGIDAQIEYQAQVAAYANDFMLMFWICLPLLPLLFLMRRPKAAPAGAQQQQMAMD